jgi:hypothetical protein
MKNIKDFISFVNENIKKVEGFWFPEKNTYCSPQEIKFYILHQSNKDDKIKFILKCLDKYNKEKLSKLSITDIDNIISNEIPLVIITKKNKKLV